MSGQKELPIVEFADRNAWARWLEENHASSHGVWLKLAKKGSGIPSVTDDELVDVGLCWGWISGQRRALNESYYLQRYVPRRPTSLWSRVNVDKVAMLTAAGRMQEPGLAEVRAAQADGRWDAAYESQRNATVPDDVAAALAENPAAKAVFDALGRTARYQLYLPVLQADRPATRAARLQKLIATLEAGDIRSQRVLTSWLTEPNDR